MRHRCNFEDLPNEIIGEVFRYFTFDELCETFSSLNVRLDALLSSEPYLQIILSKPQDFARYLALCFLPTLLTVIVDHSKKFFDPQGDSLLRNIRCLILEQPVREQWDSIQPCHFPNLERLDLINSVFTYRTEALCRLIFSNAFPFLTTCTLSHVRYEANNQWTTSLHLRSLHIYTLDARVYSQVLVACPNLFRLRLELGGDYKQHASSLIDAPRTHLRLRQLILVPSSSILSALIDALLAFVPHLEYFSLKANHRQPSCLPINTLASILEQRASRLTRIRIHLTLPDELCRNGRMHTDYRLFKHFKLHSRLDQPSTVLIVAKL